MLIRPSTMLAGVLALSAFAAHAAPVAPSPPDSVVYAVRAGDNLYTLGQRFLVDAAAVRTVQRLNAIVDPRRVPTATRLRIPVALLRAEPLTAQLIAVHGAVHITSDGHDLPATAGADADNTVNACLCGLFGEAQGGGIVEVEDAGVLDQRRVGGGIAHRGDDDGDAIATA